MWLIVMCLAVASLRSCYQTIYDCKQSCRIIIIRIVPVYALEVFFILMEKFLRDICKNNTGSYD